MFDVLLPLLLLLPSALGAAAATVRYVGAVSASPTPPYTTWGTAAQVIQDAVDAASDGDEIVVTNGIYATGGRAVGTNLLVNRVAVDKPLTVRSVNGPQFTVIQGSRCPVPPTATTPSGACIYLLECSTNLSATLCFMPVATDVAGQAGTTTYTDTNGVGAGPFFYRIGVQNP